MSTNSQSNTHVTIPAAPDPKYRIAFRLSDYKLFVRLLLKEIGTSPADSLELMGTLLQVQKAIKNIESGLKSPDTSYIAPEKRKVGVPLNAVSLGFSQEEIDSMDAESQDALFAAQMAQLNSGL